MVLAGRPLAPDVGVCVVPAVLDFAHPPVLDRQPHQAEPGELGEELLPAAGREREVRGIDALHRASLEAELVGDDVVEGDVFVAGEADDGVEPG